MGELHDKLLKEMAGVAIFEALKSLVLALASLLTGLMGFPTLVALLPILAPYKVGFIFLLVAISLLVGYGTYNNMTRNLPSFERVKSDVHILEKIISYDYRSPGQIIYRRTYRIKILRNGVDKFIDRYRWSGKNHTFPKSAKQEHTVNNLPEERLFQFFEIQFGRPYKRREVVEADVIWELQDPECTSQPVISATIYEPTDRLVMQVTLPPSPKIPKAIQTFAPEIGAKINADSMEKPFSNGNVHIWREKKPKLLHYYELRWRKLT